MPFHFSDKSAIIITAAGCGCLLGISGVLIYQRLSGLNRLIASVRHDVDQFHRELRELRELRLAQDNARANGSHTPLKAAGGHWAEDTNSITSDDDFLDALEVLSSHENLAALSKDGECLDNFVLLLQRADTLLDSTSDEDKALAYRLLKNVYAMHNSKCDFLWRLARAAYLYGNSLQQVDVEKRKQLIFEAKDYAFLAQDVNADDPEVQKWCALTLGTASDYASMSDKIKDGYQFKIHIDRALSLRPDDPVLHHLAGRWCYGVASLSWVERKVASALFGTPPSSTYDAALDAFLTVERLNPSPWKENQLYVAKVCYLAKGLNADATEWLQKSNAAPANGADDIVAQQEIQVLASKLRITLAA